MRISRTPLRVSFVGGGTDIPWFFEKYGHGSVVSAAIDKHIYISMHEMFDDQQILLKYSTTERVDQPLDLAHPIAKEILSEFDLRALDISISADVPAGTGLGSSSSFTVGLARTVFEFLGKVPAPQELAEYACQIEIQRLGEPIGKQDQYAAALGGFHYFKFHSDGRVEIKPLRLLEPNGLSGSLLLVRAGAKTRSASSLLRSQGEVAKTDPRIEQSLLEMRDLADEIGSNGVVSFDELARVVNLSWTLKKLSNPFVSNEVVDGIIELGLARGAEGAKLLGAGGGGFVLFLVKPERMAALRSVFPGKAQFEAKVSQQGSEIIFGGTNGTI